MKRLLHKVIIVLICSAVVFGGMQQLLPTPVGSELDDPGSQLVWQFDVPVEDGTGIPDKVALTTNERVETAVCTMQPPSENANPFASTGVHYIEPDSVTMNRTYAVAEGSSAKPAQTLATPGSHRVSDSSPEYSVWTVPNPAEQPDRGSDRTGESVKGIQDVAVSAPGIKPGIADNANQRLPIVDRNSPFKRDPGQSQITTSFQSELVQAKPTLSIPVNHGPVAGVSSVPETTEVPSERRITEPAAQRQTPVPSPVIEQRALEHLEYGKSLARRGATFAAREEYVQSLRLIAESNDMQTQTRDYTQMLADGLRALKESDDFVLLNAEQQLNIDLARIIATHDSNVISESMAINLSPINAMQMYFQYATEKISAAVCQSTAAADVLHAMGKLLQTSSQFDPAGKPMDRAKAIVMFQAALEANPMDYRSANELGVLLAQNGKWEMAKELFAKSLLINKSPESWLNLAKAHQQLGEQEFARQANFEFQRMAGQSKSANGMEWVSVRQFEAEGLKPEAVLASEVPLTARQTPAEPESQGNKIINGIKKWF